MTIAFQARIEHGVIAVPEEYKQALTDGNWVRVIVLHQSQSTSRTRPDIIDQLTNNPIKVDRFLTRDEIHNPRL